jgi:FAD/FMN-containing dehydrogenase
MSFPKEAYQELEDIVGQDNISDDPALLDSYVYPQNATSLHLGPWYNVNTPRGGAVVLPANVEEVQKVVQVCNKYKLKFKASSTFWGGMGYPSHEDAVQLDMRRMNHILEIDTKNNFAIIEPYVIGATLQAEAMKVGLNTHIIGAGGSCSPLASAVGFAGAGPDGLFMAKGGENMLGAEWVMPDGNVVRTGSLGAGLGWFSGEGPGPGVRGIIRGALGTRGAQGVFTKIALKLYPWPGPTKLPVTGTVPAYKTELPSNIRIHTLIFPSWEAWAESAYKIWEAEIGYIAHRQYNMFGRDLKLAMVKILTDPTKTLSDMEELLRDPEIKRQTDQMNFDYEFVLAGLTPEDIEWQEKALDEILAETGGRRAEAMEDPETAKWSLLFMLRLGHKSLNLAYGGGYDGSFCQFGTPDFVIEYAKRGTELKKEWEKKGAMVEAGGDCGMGGIGGLGGGGMTGLENFVHFDPHSKESTEGAYDFYDAASKLGVEMGIGSGIERLNSLCRGADGKEFPEAVRNQALANAPIAQALRYHRKIREAVNPNELGDAYYMTLGDKK